MTKAELRRYLKHLDFLPFEVISTSGARYPVMHPDFAFTTEEGALHVYRPPSESEGDVRFLGAVSLLHIEAVEIIRQEAASAVSKG